MFILISDACWGSDTDGTVHKSVLLAQFEREDIGAKLENNFNREFFVLKWRG